ncbi:hypothetical protein FACS189452_00130 [Bacteroidia bacterium]|nr:hypothetical protein FACS189452_00130 [Bacteroidia bacterium]GHT80149.1 hypothetical protein FACS189467_1540 [Bacteroidia bacterium]
MNKLMKNTILFKMAAVAANTATGIRTATKLQFALPAGGEQWTVSVATQATTSSNIFTKEVRRYDYQGVITVE